MAKYTFLLPAYKAKYLHDALKSISVQSYADFQVYISDDCSPENLYAIAEPFLVDSRFTYHRNAVNLGGKNLVQHWNQLLKNVSSEYVIVASDDDIYAPTFLEEIDKLTYSYPQVDLFASGLNMINEEGSEIRKSEELKGCLNLDQFCSHYFSGMSVLCMGNYVFRTSKLKKLGGFVNFPLAWKSDTATQIMMAQNGVVICGKPLFSFRMSGINISSRPIRNKENDQLKLAAALQFEQWLVNQPKTKEKWMKVFRNRLQGEIRTYYSVLSIPEFGKLYSRMVKNDWFFRPRNKVSFVYGYFVQKLGIKV